MPIVEELAQEIVETEEEIAKLETLTEIVDLDQDKAMKIEEEIAKPEIPIEMVDSDQDKAMKEIMKIEEEIAKPEILIEMVDFTADCQDLKDAQNVHAIAQLTQFDLSSESKVS